MSQLAVPSVSAEVLADGLVARGARPSDRDALVALQGLAHAGPDGAPNAGVAAWTRELFDRAHPAVSLDDVLVVTDPANGAVVSSVTLVRQVWDYAGIRLGVGRLELVATHPDYRGRGLTSAQMRLLHDRSSAAGDLLQVITDLMYYHGEFGYHAALVQRSGWGGPIEALPSTALSGRSVVLRPAGLSDIPLLAALDRHARGRGLLSCARDAELWAHELAGRDRASMMRDEFVIIEWGGRPVGFVQLGYGGIPSFPVPAWLPGLVAPEPLSPVSGLELLPDTPWLELVPAVLRMLAEERGHTGFLLWLGREHPVYGALTGCLPWRPPEIGWFVRVPDLARLLTTLAPALEERLADSPACRFTGRLRLHFYTHGVELRFTEGKIVEVRRWLEHSRRDADASMPEQMFCQLLTGHAELAELAPAYPDHRVQNRVGALLLNALFRKQTSHIWPVL